VTSPHPIDVEKLLADQLATASPDLLRGLLSTFIQALMSAEADALTNNAALMTGRPQTFGFGRGPRAHRRRAPGWRAGTPGWR
jgi:hypothetical protein